MLVNVKKILVGAAVLASFSTVGNTTASAASLNGATIAGTSPSDYFVYDVSNNNTVKVPSTQANIQKVLSGNATNPTGNVELAASSELSGFDFSKNTSLNGTLGGRAITLSSLTQADWSTSLGSQTFAQKWFGELIAANNLASSFGVNTQAEIFSEFITNGGLQRFSDPNISYVNQDNDGTVRIGLAGHYNAASLIQQSLTPTQIQLQKAFNRLEKPRLQAQEKLDKVNLELSGLESSLKTYIQQLQTATDNNKTKIQKQIDSTNIKITTAKGTIKELTAQIALLNTQIAPISAKLDPLTAFINNTNLLIKASEVVKVTYDGEAPQYLYSFTATKSGLVSKDDGISHSGNYEVTLKGKTPKPVPESSMAFGLISIGGMLLAKRKLIKNA